VILLSWYTATPHGLSISANWLTPSKTHTARSFRIISAADSQTNQLTPCITTHLSNGSPTSQLSLIISASQKTSLSCCTIVSRIILSNTAAFHLPSSKPLPLALKICRDSAVGSFLVRGLNAFSASAVKVCAKRRPLEGAVKDAYLSPYHNWDTRRAVLRFVQDIPLDPKDPSYAIVSKVEKTLPEFKNKPMLICWGAKDFVFDDHFLKVWQEKFPKADVHRFADVGHYVLEDAWEDVVPLVKKFMSETRV